MNRLVLGTLLCAALMGHAEARTIVGDVSGQGDDTFFIGQSFTTTAAAFDHVSFSFFDPTGARQALGTAYLFSAAYTGTPDGLASASANLIATAMGDGSNYIFDPSLRLSASTQYYVYSDTAMHLLGGGTYYRGGSYASSSSASANFVAGAVTGADANFILDGNFADLNVRDDNPVAVGTQRGTESNNEPLAFGQSFTTGDAALNNISFNFYAEDGSPLALGTAYLFSERYTGTLFDMPTVTRNLVGSSLASGSAYVFDPNMVLAPNTKYYLYADQPMVITGNGVSSLPGSEFSRNSRVNPFGSFEPDLTGADANFALRGTAVVAVPEPAAWAMMLIGFGTIGAGMRSRRKSTAPTLA